MTAVPRLRAPGAALVTCLLAALVAVALRVPFVHDLPYTDEGGLLVVAAHWHPDGHFLYGNLFVDRPPLLLLFFRLASDMGGIVAVRLLGLALVACAVLCAGRAGQLLGGARGAVLAAGSCAALLSDPLLGTREVDAETVGLPIVMLATVLTLEAVRRSRPERRAALLVASGATAAAALLVKQNLADALVFAVLVSALSPPAGSIRWRNSTADVAWVMLGAIVPWAGATVWAGATSNARDLWFSLYGFRFSASGSLFTGSPGQTARLHNLVVAALLSGMVVLIVVAAGVVLVHRSTDRVRLALLAMLAAEVMGVAGGGYYWSHYLIGLVPGTCLIVARACAVPARPLLLTGLVVATLIASAGQVAMAVSRRAPPAGSELAALTTWLDGSERSGDSAVVLYGNAEVFDTTHLRPAYPFLWTLPQRVLDPHLDLLVGTLDRPDDPTFVVVRSSLDPWSQDPFGRVPRALRRHYVLAARICRYSVYLRRGTARAMPPAPSCATAS